VAITGSSYSGTLTNSGANTGGIVGHVTDNGSATITTCKNSGTLTGSGENTGGIVGQVQGSGSVTFNTWQICNANGTW